MEKYNYKILAIYHSGRKGDRWSLRKDQKYYGLTECLCDFDPIRVKQFECYRLHLQGHPEYEWWDTTAVIQLARNFKGHYVLETVNTIYIFDEVKADGD